MKQTLRPASLALVLAGLVLASCGGGGGGSYGGGVSTPTAQTPPATDSGTTMVGILGDRGANSFNPNPVTVKSGAKVAWRNQDGILHRIVQDKAQAGGGDSNDPYGTPGNSGSSDGFDAGDTTPGATSNALTMNVSGTVRYHCAIHPGMTGSIVVQ
jgi:plastocyanin